MFQLPALLATFFGKLGLAAAPDLEEPDLPVDESKLPYVGNHLSQIAQRQLAPFAKAGISETLLALAGSQRLILDGHGQAAELWHARRHGLLRIRILDGVVHVRKLIGSHIRGEYWSDRQLYFLEGIISVMEEHVLPDVDFVVSLADKPFCETSIEDPLPVGVFAKRAGCPNILMPDHSLMHDGYQKGSGQSPFYWKKLAALGFGSNWRLRPPKVFYDGDFIKPSRRALSHLKPYLVVKALADLDAFNMNNYSTASDHCLYRMSLHAEGFSYSMRLKNILFCQSAAVVYEPPPAQKYWEYWYYFLEDGVHYVSLQGGSPSETLDDFGRILGMSQYKLERIAKEGQNYALTMIRPAKVREYLRILLSQYAELQRFSVADVHERDNQGFHVITKESLQQVRSIAMHFRVQNFQFHFPDPREFAAAPDSLNQNSLTIHSLPCWGTFERFRKCCPASHSNEAHSTISLSTTLHPFCQHPNQQASIVQKHCCANTAGGILPILRQSSSFVAPAQILSAVSSLMESHGNALPEEILMALVHFSRDTAVQHVTYQALPGRSSKNFEELAIAWNFEEASKLTCMMAWRAEGEKKQDQLGCADSAVFDWLAERRDRAHLQHASHMLPFRLHHQAAPEAQQPGTADSVDILLLIGRASNWVFLKSLLANRRCPLRIHILAAAGVSTAWVGELVLSHGLADVNVTQHFPQEAANEMGKYVHDCHHGEGGYECDLLYARLAPWLWLPESISWLTTFDLTQRSRGPLVLGDVCRLREVARDSSQASVYAPRHIEYAQEMRDRWSVDLIFQHLSQQRKWSLDEIFGQISTLYLDEMRTLKNLRLWEYDKDALAFWQQGQDGNVSTAQRRGYHGHRHFLRYWLHALNEATQGSGEVAQLPYSWWFVPAEPWLFEFDWDVLMRTGLRGLWKKVFAVRDYPGVNGLQVNIACPHAISYAPMAVLDPTKGNWLANANIWKRLMGWQCGQSVNVLSLYWVRSRASQKHPRVPMPLLETRWVKRLLAAYEQI